MPRGATAPHSREPAIAFLDIETAPIRGLSWEIYDTNLIHVEEPTFILCYAIKWKGQKKVATHALCDFPLYKKDKSNDIDLIRKLWDDLDSADIVIAHNGDAFDIKKINARFLVHGLQPPTPFKTVDTLKIARRHFRFDSNKLDNIGRYLQVGRKLAHTGKDLWLGCMRGEPDAWRLMRRYNARDVELLESVYEKLKAWSPGHPVLTSYLAPSPRVACPTCTSTNTHRRGWNVARHKKTPRFQCQDCGHWFYGAQYEVKKAKGEA